MIAYLYNSLLNKRDMNNLTKFEEKEMDILADIDYLKQKLGTLHDPQRRMLVTACPIFRWVTIFITFYS